MHYIWIDALCILQDDEVDWEIESAKMNQVFKNALFVICVTFGIDSHSGFLSPDPGHTNPIGIPVQERDARRASIRKHILLLSIDGQMIEVHVRKRLQHSAIMNTLKQNMEADIQMPVLSRAWCFQERLLALRTVHFTPEEMIWECSNTIWRECGAGEFDAFMQQFNFASSPSVSIRSPVAAYNATFNSIEMGDEETAD